MPLSQTTWISLLTLILCLILLSTLICLSLWSFRKVLADKKEVELAQIELMNKAVALLSAKDPLAYQMIQAMDSQSSVSEEKRERNIDELLAAAEAGEYLTEEEYARIDEANFGHG